MNSRLLAAGEFASCGRWRICSLRIAGNLPEDPSGGELGLKSLGNNSRLTQSGNSPANMVLSSRIHRSLEAANSPAEGTAANSPGKAVIIKRASPGWEEALFIIGFALPYLLLAEEEGDHCQKQESGITGVASAAAAT